MGRESLGRRRRMQDLHHIRIILVMMHTPLHILVPEVLEPSAPNLHLHFLMIFLVMFPIKKFLIHGRFVQET